jgi:high-affinity iron transporter
MQSLSKTVWAGMVSAAGVSLLAALGLNWIGAEFEGRGEQLFEGTTMFLAAGILTWIIFWMNNQSKSMRKELEASIKNTSAGRSQSALFFLVFLAVVREGIELALFLLAARLASNPLQVILGSAMGLTMAALTGWLIFASSLKLSLARFFQATNILLVFFAAGLVGMGIHEFNELGWIPAITEHVWDLSPILSDQSTPGLLLKALVGYSSSPSLSQVIGYLAYLGLLLVLVWNKRRPPQAARIIPEMKQSAHDNSGMHQ